MINLKDLVRFFCNIQTTRSKEEAFLKGYLMGLGGHNICPTPDWQLLKEYPDMTDIESEMREMFEKIHKKDIEEAQRLLAELQKEGKI